MRNITTKSGAILRHVFPLVRKTRQWSWKYFDRTAQRLVISGGTVPFMDATLHFPEGVGLTYATPLFWDGGDAYEGPTSRLLALLVKNSRVFLDVGSNIGIYAVYTGVKYPAIATFAFEPVPAICEKNRRFHRANGLPEERVLNMAIGDREGEQEFVLPVYTTGVEEEQTGTLNTQSWQAREKVVERIKVQCTTLDRFAARQTLPEGLCCLKIDVENHELAVLQGGREFIQSRRPWIVCEVLPNQKIDPVTGVGANDNGGVLALVEQLAYLPFAVLADGLFRMTAQDFERPREFKDFLLAPAESVPATVSYLALSSLEKLLPTS